MTDVAAVEAAITDAHRSDWAGMLAATVRVARDLDLAEECVQEAYASAMKTWVSAGIPDKPAAWLTTTAKRRAIDAIRRDKAFRSRLPLLVEPEEAADEVTMREPTDGDAGDPGEGLPDERLKLERDGRLSGYQYLPAIKADLLSRLGRSGPAAAAYRQAPALAANEAERAFLAERIADHTSSP